MSLDHSTTVTEVNDHDDANYSRVRRDGAAR